MTEADARYRLLLRVYPRGPRRAELLDTLLTTAPRPGPRVVADLLRHGLRARLGRAGSRAVVVAAVLVSLVGGFLAGSAFEALGWAATPRLPGTAAAVAEVVTPGRPAPDRGDPGPITSVHSWTHYLVGGDDEDAYGRISIDATPGGGLAVTRERLANAGWHYRGASGDGFWATKGGFAVEVTTETPLTEAEDPIAGAPGTAPLTVLVDIVRIQPVWLTVLALLGGLAGTLATWFLFGWISRRTAELTGPGVLAVLFLVLMLPQAGLGASLFTSDALYLAMPSAPPWVSLFKLFGWAMFVLALLIAALSVLIAAATKPVDAQQPRPA